MDIKRRRGKGTDNVLVDLGFEDAEELSAKALLAIKFNDLAPSADSAKPRPQRSPA